MRSTPPPLSHAAGNTSETSYGSAKLVPSAASRPKLRLINTKSQTSEAAPITRHDDPRWALAVKVADAMEGSLLPPEKRKRLIRLGQALGLTSFDANLIIASVQDQARRGVSSARLAASAEPALRLIASPAERRRKTVEKTNAAFISNRWRTVWILVGVLALELLLIFAALR